MDVKKLRRDPAAIKKTIVEVGNTTSTKTGCSILIPSRYETKGMASLGTETYILGIFAMVVNELVYAISKAPTLVRIDPVETRRVMIDDEEYLRFDFPAGSTVIANKDVVVEDTINYNIFDYFIDDGKVPWFLEYDDMLTLFEHGKKFTGGTIAPNPAVLSLLASIIYRDSRDKMRFYRQVIKTQQDKEKIKPATVAFHSVLHGPRSTLTRLSGSYFDDGLVTSLVNPTDKVDPIERSLR